MPLIHLELIFKPYSKGTPVLYIQMISFHWLSLVIMECHMNQNLMFIQIRSRFGIKAFFFFYMAYYSQLYR